VTLEAERLGAGTAVSITSAPMGGLWRGATDARGRIAFEHVPGHVALRLRARLADGAKPQKHERSMHLTLAPGEQRTVSWVVDPPTATVTGHARDEAGVPWADLEIVAVADVRPASRPSARMRKDGLAASGRTNGQGRFTLHDLPAGDLWILPAWDQERVALVSTVVHVEDGRADPADLELVLPPTWRLGGRVVDERGAPVAGARLRVFDDHGTLHIADSDAAGSFGLALAPRAHTLEAWYGSSDRVSRKERVSPGQTDVVVQLGAEGAIRVRVLDAQGGVPAVADEIEVGRTFDHRVAELETTLPPGEHVLVSQCADGRIGARKVSIEPGRTTSVELVLSLGVELVLECPRDARAPVQARIFADEVELPERWLRPGEITRVLAPAGALRVEEWQEGRTASYRFELEPGASRKMTLGI
jgi:hypothetical protein